MAHRWRGSGWRGAPHLAAAMTIAAALASCGSEGRSDERGSGESASDRPGNSQGSRAAGETATSGEPATSDEAAPAVTPPPPDRALATDLDGAHVTLRLDGGTQRVPVVEHEWSFVAVGQDGAEHQIDGWPPPIDGWCSSCGQRPQPIGMPAHAPIQLIDGVVLRFFGPRPGHRAQRTCSDGTACSGRLALPPGDYRLVTRGDVFDCPQVRFTVPLTESVEGRCQRIDERAR